MKEGGAVWFCLREGPRAPAWNMALDEALLSAAATIGHPVLRLYGWTVPAATFGYSQKYEDIAGWTELRPLIRRPTGGGLVPHDADWTYSFVVPPSHPWHQLRAQESYRRIHEWIADSLRDLQVPATLAADAVILLPGRCFIGAEKSDVLANGRKIAGAAQKRNRLGLLIQGSLQPAAGWQRERWEGALLRRGAAMFSATWRDLIVSRELEESARILERDKYGAEQYNRRR